MATKTSQQIQIGKDVVVNRKNHDKLVEHIIDRMDWAKQIRDSLADKFEIIDRELAGHIVLDAEDEKRDRDNKRGFGPKPVDVNLPLTAVQLDEAVTVLLTVLAPDEGIYSATAPMEKQAIAKGFSSVMNKHAQTFGHYAQYAKFLFAALKYNFSPIGVEWTRILGNKVVNGATQLPEVQIDLLRDGNELTAFSPYNFFYDISVSPLALPTHGEFFATVELQTPFRIRKMGLDEELFGVERYAEIQAGGHKYYREPPTVSPTISSGVTTPNWFQILSGESYGSQMGKATELLHFTCWINPREFGLLRGKEKPLRDGELQIWRFTLADNQHIASAVHLSNAHAMLPCAIAMPWDDELGLNAKSYAEMLIPYQRFSSFQLNIHQRAARKALYGVTFYNKSKAPLFENADPVAAKIPVNNVDDVNKLVKQFRDVPDTSNTLRDIEAMDTLMQKILPTDLLKQVTDLERATRYQAAATVQGANRRNLKIAKIVDSQCLTHIRSMQMYNIFQYQQAMEIIDPQTGSLVNVDPAQFRDAGLEFEISDGLRGLDKLAIIEGIKDVLSVIAQSAQANETINIVEVINYWTGLMGDKTDFSQFRFKTPFDALSMEEKNMAFQLLQQAVQQAQAQQQGGGATVTQ